MKNMIKWDKQKNLDLTQNKKSLLKLDIYTCYKDLSGEDYSGLDRILIIFIETSLNITRLLTYPVKSNKNNINCLFKAKWRNQLNNLQEGKI